MIMLFRLQTFVVAALIVRCRVQTWSRRSAAVVRSGECSWTWRSTASTTSLVAKDIKVYMLPRTWQFRLVALVTSPTFVGDYVQIYLMLLQIVVLYVFNFVVARDVVLFKLLASVGW